MPRSAETADLESVSSLMGFSSGGTESAIGPILNELVFATFVSKTSDCLPKDVYSINEIMKWKKDTNLPTGWKCEVVKKSSETPGQECYNRMEKRAVPSTSHIMEEGGI